MQSHIERFGPFTQTNSIRVPGHIVDFTVDNTGRKFHIWSRISEKSFEADYWIASNDAYLKEDLYIRSAFIGLNAYHLMRVNNGKARKSPGVRQVASRNEEPNIDHNEGDQQEVLLEDRDPAVGADCQTVEVGEPFSGEEGALAEPST